MNKSFYTIFCAVFILCVLTVPAHAKWKFEDLNSPDVQAAVKEALGNKRVREGKKISAKVYDIEYPKPEPIIYAQEDMAASMFDALANMEDMNANAADQSASEGDIILATDEISAQVTEYGYKIDFVSDILFDFDSAVIKPEAQNSLNALSDFMKSLKLEKIHVTGHTDSKGTQAYNKRLSRQRATSVIQWLQKHTNAQILGYAMGESQPVAPNAHPDGSDNPEGRKQNRRVEVQLYKQR